MDHVTGEGEAATGAARRRCASATAARGVALLDRPILVPAIGGASASSTPGCSLATR